MHIAFFTNTYHPFVSGVVRSISSFRQALTDLGQNVFVFAQQVDDYIDEEPFIFRYPSFNISWPTDFHAVIPISSHIDYLIPSLKLDVIHTHHPILLGRTAATKAAELNIPLVFTFHSQYSEYTQYLPLNQETIQDFIKDLIDTRLVDFMKKCHHIVVPSSSMLELLHEVFGLNESVSVVPTGIDSKRFKDADGQPIRKKLGWNDDIVLISVGRLGPEKNWETLLNACAPVMHAHPNFRAAIIGDGLDRDKLKKHTEKMGIANRVEFLGTVPYDQIPCYLKAADIFGFASVAETQGLVTMEAVAAGLPVVAIDAVGTRDNVKHNEQGLLTPNDSQALAQAITRLVENPELRYQFSKSATKRADEFDMTVQADKLIGVYEQAILDHKHGRFVVLNPARKLSSLSEFIRQLALQPE
jgi:glycosyltransferase involved in cell wall biosynthesis